MKSNPQFNFWFAFVALSVGVFGILFSNYYLPLTDLPQFAAHISMLRDIRNPNSLLQASYQTNWLSPYVLSIALSYFFSFFFSVMIAVKIVIFLALIGLPLSMVFFLHKIKGSRWFAILGFPLAFGIIFAWGFISMIVAMPLSVLFLSLVLEMETSKSLGWRRSLLLILLSLLIFFSHAFVFCFVLLVALVIFGYQRQWVFFPLLSLALLPLVWTVSNFPHNTPQQPLILWELGLSRIKEFPAAMLGFTPDPWGGVFGGLVLLMLFLPKPHLSKSPLRWAIFSCAVVCLLLTPRVVSWVSMIDQRFVFFVVLGLITVLAPNENACRRWHSVMIVLIAAGWIGIQGVRFARFNVEARDFRDILEKLEPHKKILSLVVHRESGSVPGYVYLHFPSWAVVEKNCTTAFSFSEIPQWVLRKKDPHVDPWPGILSWNPAEFKWTFDKDNDYFMTRSLVDPTKKIFKADQDKVILLSQSGAWWLYQKKKL